MRPEVIRNNKGRFLRSLLYVGMMVAGLYLIGFFTGDDPQKTPQEDFRSLPVEYTRHASCRMDCRQISPEEVKSVLRSGTLNERKSDPSDKPCPTYAIEGKTADGQRVRIIVAACENESRIVTAIDLDNEYDCDCP